MEKKREKMEQLQKVKEKRKSMRKKREQPKQIFGKRPQSSKDHLEMRRAIYDRYKRKGSNIYTFLFIISVHSIRITLVEN